MAIGDFQRLFCRINHNLQYGQPKQNHLTNSSKNSTRLQIIDAICVKPNIYKLGSFTTHDIHIMRIIL